MGRFLVMLLVGALLGGCNVPSAAPTLAQAERYWLPPIIDGETPSKAVTERLGEPERFARGSALAYRMIVIGAPPGVGGPPPAGGDTAAPSAPPARVERWWRDILPQNGVMYVVRPEHYRELTAAMVGRQSEYTLVIEQDAAGIIRRHALREVPP
jgi:hypothetical protein